MSYFYAPYIPLYTTEPPKKKLRWYVCLIDPTTSESLTEPLAILLETRPGTTSSNFSVLQDLSGNSYRYCTQTQFNPLRFTILNVRDRNDVMGRFSEWMNGRLSVNIQVYSSMDDGVTQTEVYTIAKCWCKSLDLKLKPNANPYDSDNDQMEVVVQYYECYHHRGWQKQSSNLMEWRDLEGKTTAKIESTGELVVEEVPDEVNLVVESEEIAAKTRKLKAVWSHESQQDLRYWHNLDAEAKLTAVPAQEINNSGFPGDVEGFEFCGEGYYEGIEGYF